MALNLNNIPGTTRKELILAGQRFASEDTLAQAEQTLSALSRHAAKLVDHGFGPEDVQELTDARDELIASGVGREAKRSDKKITSQAYLDAMRTAQQTRLRARSVLGSAMRILTRVEGEKAATAVREIDAVLEHGSLAGEDAEKLAAQLDQLKAAFEIAEVEDAAKTRGGPKAVADLAAHAAALRDLSQTAAGPRGTPLETEKLDLIDGIILSLVRSAREAADAAGKALGEPALMTEFELTKLYKPSKAKPKAGEGTVTSGESEPKGPGTNQGADPQGGSVP